MCAAYAQVQLRLESCITPSENKILMLTHTCQWETNYTINSARKALHDPCAWSRILPICISSPNMLQNVECWHVTKFSEEHGTFFRRIATRKLIIIIIEGTVAKCYVMPEWSSVVSTAEQNTCRNNHMVWRVTESYVKMFRNWWNYHIYLTKFCA